MKQLDVDESDDDQGSEQASSSSDIREVPRPLELKKPKAVRPMAKASHSQHHVHDEAALLQVDADVIPSVSHKVVEVRSAYFADGVEIMWLAFLALVVGVLVRYAYRSTNDIRHKKSDRHALVIPGGDDL